MCTEGQQWRVQTTNKSWSESYPQGYNLIITISLASLHKVNHSVAKTINQFVFAVP